MNKIIIFTALFALVAIAGQAKTYKTDSVTVCFQLASKAQGEKATLIYPNFLTCNVVALHPVTDNEGKWTVKIPAYRTLHIQIWDDNKIQGVVWGALNLFCRPGTQVEISLDDINDRCIFTGENAEVHNAQIQHPLKIENFHGRMFEIDMQEAAKYIRRIYEQNSFRIDTLCKANPNLPEKYVESLRQMARYGYAMDMTQNIVGHIVESMGEILKDSLPKEHLDLFREVETEDLLYPRNPLPLDATTYFRDVIWLEDIVQNGFIRERPERITDLPLHHFTMQCAVIDSIDASDDVKQMMKTYSFLQNCDNEMNPEREKHLESQLTAENFTLLRQHIDSKKTQFANIPEEQNATLEETPIDSLIDGKEIFQKLIAPHRGRVIYIDVWGTWCGPCQREMEHLPKLHKALNDLPVTYMYFANNSPEELWRKSAKHFGLEGADCVNLRLPDAQQNAVEEYLGIQGFPTFILVATDGTIVTSYAPRPSNPSGVREAILKLLNK